MSHPHGHAHGETSVRRAAPEVLDPDVASSPAATGEKGVAAPRSAGERIGENEVLLPSAWSSRPQGWARLTAGARALTTSFRTHPDEGSIDVRLGRHVWPRLVVRPGDPIEVEVLDDLPVAERITLDVDRTRTDSVREHLLAVAPTILEPLQRGTEITIDHPLEGRLDLRVRDVTPAPSRFGSATVVDVVQRDADHLMIRSSLADVGGAADILEDLRRQIELPLLRPELYAEAGIVPPKGAILHGPPGTGKTLMLRAVARSLGVTVKALSGGDLARALRGETEKILRDLFREAVREAPTVILVDEFDAIGGHRDRMAAQDDIRAVSQLLSLMDGLERTPGVVVLASTNRLSAIDEAFLRPGRFDLQIKVGAPSEADRLEILSVHCRDMPLSEAARDELRAVARQTAGYVGADLMHLARLAALRAVERTSEDADVDRQALVVEVDDLRSALRQVRPSSLAAVTATEGEAEWDRVLGLDGAKASLVAAAERAFGSVDGGGMAQGVLLHGPPGNGKSVLAKALARELDVGLVTLEPARIFRPWLGESETALREVFERAELSAPCVLVIEHLGALASSGSAAPGERTDDRVKAALLACIDETVARGGVLVIGIARDAGEVDSQLARPGRLGMHVAIPNPDADARRLLLLQRWADAGQPIPLAIGDLITRTEGRSAADVLYADLDLDLDSSAVPGDHERRDELP